MTKDEKGSIVAHPAPLADQAERYRSRLTAQQLRERAVDASARGFRVFPVKLVREADGKVTKKPLIPGYLGDNAFAASTTRKMPWSSR